MNMYIQVYAAAKHVFEERHYRLFFAAFAVLFFAVFVFVPVVTVPGNTFIFQLSIFRPQDYILMIFLALLVALNLSMNMYVLKQQKQTTSVSGSTASGTAAGFGGVFAAVVGTASCASCLAALFGIVGLGIGSVAFVLEYQAVFLLGAIALTVISLYFASKKVVNACGCAPVKI